MLVKANGAHLPESQGRGIRRSKFAIVARFPGVLVEQQQTRLRQQLYLLAPSQYTVVHQRIRGSVLRAAPRRGHGGFALLDQTRSSVSGTCAMGLHAYCERITA